MAFRLGSESRGFKHSGNVKFIRTPLEKGTVAEARHDNVVAIDIKVRPGSAMERKAVKHELAHIEQMESGRASYGENWVMWEGKIYIRENGIIDGPNGRWPEGDPNHPWEVEAIQAEKQ